jgi:hypothetical protein
LEGQGSLGFLPSGYNLRCPSFANFSLELPYKTFKFHAISSSIFQFLQLFLMFLLNIFLEPCYQQTKIIWSILFDQSSEDLWFFTCFYVPQKSSDQFSKSSNSIYLTFYLMIGTPATIKANQPFYLSIKYTNMCMKNCVVLINDYKSTLYLLK